MPSDEASAILPAAHILPFRLRPSRAFAVRQAIVTALHEAYPLLLGSCDTLMLCEHLVGAYELTGRLPDDFVWLARRNFREICARYDLREMGQCR